ncbi:HD domain-containing protein [Mucilaginibacter defluvii]|uniref:HD domain-containing protein n=1 Tax=Mucilaginibacter defluvii TaxID=1196019 RepID=A0ABP9FPN5_9SPHI
MDLITKTQDHVTAIFKKKLPAGMAFHHIGHTRTVVAGIRMLTAGVFLNEWERHAVLIAGWFHDTGYCYTYEGHEAISMTLAGDFLRAEGRSENFIKLVYDCIRATQMPQTPQTLLQMIICDADMLHLSRPDYLEKAAMLRLEWEFICKRTYTDDAWTQLNYDHLMSHQYFTDMGKLEWSAGKERNLRLLERQLPEQDL